MVGLWAAQTEAQTRRSHFVAKLRKLQLSPAGGLDRVYIRLCDVQRQVWLLHAPRPQPSCWTQMGSVRHTAGNRREKLVIRTEAAEIKGSSFRR